MPIFSSNFRQLYLGVAVDRAARTEVSRPATWFESVGTTFGVTGQLKALGGVLGQLNRGQVFSLQRGDPVAGKIGFNASALLQAAHNQNVHGQYSQAAVDVFE